MSLSIVTWNYQDRDRGQCRSVWRELTEWHREIYQDSTIGGGHPEDYFDKHLAKVGPKQIWVAVHESKVVGMAGLIIEENEAEIEPLIVSKAYRGKGVGTQLIKTVVAEARKLGVKFLIVGPVARNINAIKFLYKQGFKTLGNVELCMCFGDYAWEQGPKLFWCKFKY